MLSKTFLFAACLLAAVTVKAQQVSTEGREFWLSYMLNFTIDTAGRNFELSVYVTAKENSTVVLSNVQNTYQDTVLLSAGEIKKVVLPPAPFYVTDSNTISRKVLHIQSSANISVYAFNYKQYSADATIILPVPALGSQYILSNYASRGEEFLFTAAQNNTVVNITPADTLTRPFSITLNKGDAYLYVPRSDQSGALVSTANPCYKLAVFAGNSCTNIPAPCLSCDHLYEQLKPINTLGTQYLVTPTLSRTRDLLQVMAIKDSTRIQLNNSAPFYLKKGQYHDTSINAAQYIRSSYPIQTALYAEGSSCAGISGDPFMIIIPPVEQTIDTIQFALPETFVINTLFANVHIRTRDIGRLYVDGQLSQGPFTPFQANPAWSYIRLQLSPGAHTLVNAGGLLAYGYGYGQAESYGYALGSNVTIVRQKITANQLEIPNRDTVAFCLGSTVQFAAEIEDSTYTSVQWQFSDNTSYTGSSLTKTFPTPGIYKVLLMVSYTNTGCVQPVDTSIAWVFIPTSNSLTLGNPAFCDTSATIAPILLTPNIFLQDAQYRWSTGDTTATVQISVPGTYWLTETSPQCTLSDTITVNIESVTVSAGPDKTVSWRVPFTLDGSATGSNLALAWAPAAHLSNPAVLQPVAVADTNTVYYLTAVTPHGCRAVDSVHIMLKEIDEVYMPSAFSPDGNGRNDIFRPIIPTGQLLQFSVYNRWGQLLFSTQQSRAGWDGRLNGHPQPPGTYVYIVRARFPNGTVKTIKGAFLLVN